MTVKVFTSNERGKIEFTQKELEELLNEIYNSGYADGSSKYITWTSPTISSSPTVTLSTPFSTGTNGQIGLDTSSI